MTLRDVMGRQALPIGNPDRFFAVGGYQIVPKTMVGAVDDLKPPLDAAFSQELQDFLFAWHLLRRKRRDVQLYIEGKSGDRKKAQIAMALEWASLAHPDTGKSAYDGKAGNSASMAADDVGRALDEARARFGNAQSSGLDYETSWELAVFGEKKREPWNESAGSEQAGEFADGAPVYVAAAVATPIRQPEADTVLQDPDFLAWKAEREQARMAKAYKAANAKPLASSMVTKVVVGGIASWLAVKYGVEISPEYRDIAENIIVGAIGAGAIYGRQRATTFISGIFSGGSK
ncbi:hypothetical protein VSS37_03785 [Candidatus Thiothrix sp. Deng01]|uniref:Uncharacterized protein n=1 Tax=Candidatus Thiothrix phosphatis TaxID=3112415 RepID=A0ABU6CVI5_9GAMM|nr:hypothetical protein [Candidatus Thiothrix sp. Deng01]MEB4590092.1 hypothetical protein [Candidatus Thiothrix sp. Deng01]